MQPCKINMQTTPKYYQKPNMVSQVWSEFNVRSKWNYLSILLIDASKCENVKKTLTKNRRKENGF
jgi:hypothetical protein